MSASGLQKLLSVEYSWLNLNFQDRCRDKCSVGCKIETTFSKMWIKKNNVYLCCEQQDFNIGGQFKMNPASGMHTDGEENKKCS